MNVTRNRPQRQRPPGGGQRGGRPPNRQYGQRSNGPGRDNGNAQRNYDRYIVLAREATLSGDTIEAENCYQHAEHYFRVMRERTN
jgi:hypothetical protein